MKTTKVINNNFKFRLLTRCNDFRSYLVFVQVIYFITKFQLNDYVNIDKKRSRYRVGNSIAR